MMKLMELLCFLILHTVLKTVDAQGANIKTLYFNQPSFPTENAWNYREDNLVDYDFAMRLQGISKSLPKLCECKVKKFCSPGCKG